MTNNGSETITLSRSAAIVSVRFSFCPMALRPNLQEV